MGFKNLFKHFRLQRSGANSQHAIVCILNFSWEQKILWEMFLKLKTSVALEYHLNVSWRCLQPWRNRFCVLFSQFFLHAHEIRFFLFVALSHNCMINVCIFNFKIVWVFLSSLLKLLKLFHLLSDLKILGRFEKFLFALLKLKPICCSSFPDKMYLLVLKRYW